jgi:hypothetical protein
MSGVSQKSPKDKLDELVETDYFVKHYEMERALSRSHILSPQKLEKDSELRDQLLLSKKKRIVQRKLSESPPFSWFRLKYYLHKNTDMVALLFIELNSQIFAHPLNTVKCRIQARHALEDVAHFQKNKVDKKSVYLGLTYSYLMTGLGCSVFANMHKIFAALSNKYSWMRSEHILYASFTATDLITSPLRCMLEVRRSYFQMGNLQMGLSETLRKSRQAYCTLLLRDFIFRTSVFSFFSAEQSNERIGHRYLKFASAIFLSSLISAPFDVIFAKISTQKSEKYSGLKNSLKTIILEEGYGKLVSGFSLKFSLFMITGTVNALLYHRMLGFTKESFSVDSLL